MRCSCCFTNDSCAGTQKAMPLLNLPLHFIALKSNDHGTAEAKGAGGNSALLGSISSRLSFFSQINSPPLAAETIISKLDKFPPTTGQQLLLMHREDGGRQREGNGNSDNNSTLHRHDILQSKDLNAL